MATSKSSANLKEKKASSISPSSSTSNLHGSRRSPMSSVPGSPEHEGARALARSLSAKQSLNSSTTAASKQAKSQLPTSTATTPSHRPPAKKTLEKGHPSPSNQPLKASTAQTSLKEKTATTKTSSTPSTLPRSAPSSKPPASGASEKAPKTTLKSSRTTTQAASPLPARGRSPAGSIAKERENAKPAAAAPAAPFEESPVIVPVRNEEEVVCAPTQVEAEEVVGSEKVEETDETELQSIEMELINEEPKQDEPDHPEEEADKTTLDVHHEDHEEGDINCNNNDTVIEEAQMEEKPVVEVPKEAEKEEPSATDKIPGGDHQDHADDQNNNTSLVSTENPINDPPEQKEADEKDQKETAPPEAEAAEKPVVVQGGVEGAGAGKKEGQKSNEVIEETRTKLLEKKRSRVLALVGAFETVMSMQETQGQAN